MRSICLATMFLVACATAAHGAESVAGNWTVALVNGGQELKFWLVSLKQNGDKWEGSAKTLEDGVPESTVKDIKVEKSSLTFTINASGDLFDFRCVIPATKKLPAFLRGSASNGGQLRPSVIRRVKASTAYEYKQELVLSGTDDPAIFDAALELVAKASAKEATPKEVQAWVSAAADTAAKYGKRWQIDFSLKIVDALATQKGYEKVTVAAAEKAASAAAESTPATLLRALDTLKLAYAKAGLKEKAQTLAGRIDKLESKAHEEYAETALPFEVKEFKGRKKASKRRVLVELFTGAQCPPCVAADLAFDALGEAFDANEVVLLQYHLHIPRPDALTNADTEARLDYYGDLIQGTPTVLFDGKTVGEGGGGGKSVAQLLFKQYQAAVESKLEEPAGAKIQVRPLRKGDKIVVRTLVSDLNKTGKTVRLRLALVEKWVRYRGSNGLPYHHHVVRAMPGGVKGTALTKKEMEQSTTIDLADLRDKVNRYLDNYAARFGFPDGQRPLALRNLRIVAFVQDDATRQVMQAIEVPIPSK